MKKLTLLLLIVLPVWDMGQTKSDYHIRVQCFGSTGKWYISFTPNNWYSEYPIYNAFDISETIGQNDNEWMCFQKYLFDDKQSAINFAKQFKSFYQCCQFNDLAIKKYHQIRIYRALHPIKTQSKKLIEDKNCCTVTQVY